jgi:nicotinamidase-related amidase
MAPKRALLVIDVQNEYFDWRMPVTYPEGSLPRILRAMEAARAAKIPVLGIRHVSPDPEAPAFREGSRGAELHSSLASFPWDGLLAKRMPGSFTGTDLEERLRARGVGTVTIAGYMTQMCCDTTSRQACHRGFRVEFLADGTGTLAVSNNAGSVTAEELHRATLVTQAMRFAEVLTAEEWIARIGNES